MEKTYHIAEKSDSRSLTDFLVKNGQGLLPMVELIEQSQQAVDELIDVVARATIEAVLRLSGEGIAGPPHRGKKGGRIGWQVCHVSRRRLHAIARWPLWQGDPNAALDLPESETARCRKD